MRQLDGLPHIEGCYGGRAGDRTPMQWNTEKNKGFSPADPEKLYRTVDLSPDAPDVVSQEQDRHSLIYKVKELIKLHNTEPALAAYAEFVPVYVEKDKYPFAYIRAQGKERLLVVINPANRKVSATFNLSYACQKPQLILGDGMIAINKDKIVSVDINAVGYAIFRMNEE
jgi:maltose alpha-D-glucosyltransferase/alpha-amylase